MHQVVRPPRAAVKEEGKQKTSPSQRERVLGPQVREQQTYEREDPPIWVSTRSIKVDKSLVSNIFYASKIYVSTFRKDLKIEISRLEIAKLRQSDARI